jgi:hypothetical protein
MEFNGLRRRTRVRRRRWPPVSASSATRGATNRAPQLNTLEAKEPSDLIPHVLHRTLVLLSHSLLASLIIESLQDVVGSKRLHELLLNHFAHFDVPLSLAI